MESKIADAKAKIKSIKNDLLGLMPNEIQSFGKKAVEAVRATTQAFGFMN